MQEAKVNEPITHLLIKADTEDLQH